MATKRPTSSAHAGTNKPRNAEPIGAIPERAYQHFLSRGGEHGHDLDDWLRAESEILAASTSEQATRKAGSNSANQAAAGQRGRSRRGRV